MASLTFLGTGNFLAPGRYWNSFVVDGCVLVEPAPTALPHLRRCGIPVEQLDAVVISHFHPDHTFGWPFLLLEFVKRGRSKPLHIVGPPGVETFLAAMMHLAGVDRPGSNVQGAAHAELDLRYIEVDSSWQTAGTMRFRAVEVEHVAHLQCFGFLFDSDGRTIGYSGDTRPCRGLDEIATASDVLVLECNGRHHEQSHMDVESVRALRARHPQVPFVLTHLGADVDGVDIAGAVVPDDLQTLSDV